MQAAEKVQSEVPLDEGQTPLPMLMLDARTIVSQIITNNFKGLESALMKAAEVGNM